MRHIDVEGMFLGSLFIPHDLQAVALDCDEWSRFLVDILSMRNLPSYVAAGSKKRRLHFRWREIVIIIELFY